jgi:hypothetical protein
VEVYEPHLLRYSWADGGGGDVTEVAYRIEEHEGGTRLTYDHTGFTGIGGMVVSKILSGVRRKMLTVGLPPVLEDLDDQGHLLAGRTQSGRN